MKLLISLFFEFFKTGLFAIGGGLATLPFLYEMSEKTGWFTVNDIANLVAVSESTPGPMGVNMATYVGYTTSGIIGSLIGPLGLVTPSIVIIIIVSKILKRFKDSKITQYAFEGLRAASTALIAYAGCSVAKLALFDTERYQRSKQLQDLFSFKGIILAFIIFACIKWQPVEKLRKHITGKENRKTLHPIIYIFVSAIVGITFQF